jgi:Mrr N-terminal domain/Protein of unknown function DUF262
MAEDSDIQAPSSGLPKAEELLTPALQLSKRGSLRVAEAVDRLASQFGLSPASLEERSANGDLKFDKNVRWAVTHLAQAGLVERPVLGTYAATERGRTALAERSNIDFAYLKLFPEYRDFLTRRRGGEEEDQTGEDEVEPEPDDEASLDFRTPYDPKAIRVDPRVYSVRQLLDMVDDGEVDLAPDFQRLKVWKPWQRSQLVESLLLRIPLPTFYFSADEDGLLQVVDGVQRLTTIHDFVRKEAFKLGQLEYLQDTVGGKSFRDLENTVWSRRILNTQLSAYVIDPQTPISVKFDIFRRINTGGSPLNAQEIRHCMSRNRSREFLRELADEEVFHRATGGNFRNHVRMVDRELVLRFLAFSQLNDVSDYERVGSMEEFLTTATGHLDDPSQISDDQLSTLHQAFVLSMENACTVFGKHAFRKWFADDDVLYPVNRSLFDVWSVELSKHSRDSIAAMADRLQQRARTLLTEDDDFLNAISTSTSSPAKVISRFRKVHELFGEGFA